MEEFKIENLKNGQLVWFERNPTPYIFFKDVVTTHYSGDVFVRHGDTNWIKGENFGDRKIVKVANQKHPFNLSGVRIDLPDWPIQVVWELRVETEQERQIKELQETIRKAQAQIDELAKAV